MLARIVVLLPFLDSRPLTAGRSAAANSASEAPWAPKVDAGRLPNDSWNPLLARSCSALGRMR
jgi:hypothetical protein